jgi:hypothetical protein
MASINIESLWETPGRGVLIMHGPSTVLFISTQPPDISYVQYMELHSITLKTKTEPSKCAIRPSNHSGTHLP